jgi:hypothetical protein
MLKVPKVALRREPTMIAMVGKYIVYVKETKLILSHPAGNSFDLTQEDAVELAVLISNWQRAIEVGLCESELEAKQTEESIKPFPIQVSEEIHSEG